MVSLPYTHQILQSTLTYNRNQVFLYYMLIAIEAKKSRFNPYTLNYGTVVGIAGEDFVVVAGDTRLSEGYSIVTRN